MCVIALALGAWGMGQGCMWPKQTVMLGALGHGAFNEGLGAWGKDLKRKECSTLQQLVFRCMPPLDLGHNHNVLYGIPLAPWATWMGAVVGV
jgi:hypothetical protein